MFPGLFPGHRRDTPRFAPCWRCLGNFSGTYQVPHAQQHTSHSSTAERSCFKRDLCSTAAAPQHALELREQMPSVLRPSPAKLSTDCQRHLSTAPKKKACYRFDSKLKVTWQLPDADLLYDMVITSLTLQIVIEKMIVLVVEMTTEPICIDIAITWQNDVAKIDILTRLSPTIYQQIHKAIRTKLSFGSQIDILRQYYGDKSTIVYCIDEHALDVTIQYPLKDVGQQQNTRFSPL